jgi:phosphatidylserine/phosphatidylglycerophosphate/cardiolipin synthase-like enzyme
MKIHLFARSHNLLVISIIVLLLAACALPISYPFKSSPTPTADPLTGSAAATEDPSAASPNPALDPAEPKIERLQIFFTDPTAPHARDYRGGPDAGLAGEIDKAHLSVDVAAYSLNLWSIRDALIHAYQRGVVVRMVMESDNMDNQEVQQIQDAGIPIVGDQQEGLMHNKFVIIDRRVVWTGSMNFTVGGAYKDNNNLVRLQSDKIAEDYTNEFDEMFIHHLFGPDTYVNTPYPNINLDGTLLEVYFSPDDQAEARIEALIQNAKTSINFMAYAFTSNPIGDAIVQKAQEGVSVAGVMDGGQVASGQGSEYDPFMQAGLDVRLDGNQAGLMHHKVIIIDQSIVITGSYNFTASASDTNDENVVIIYNSVIARKYLEEFQRVYEQAPEPEMVPTP